MLPVVILTRHAEKQLGDVGPRGVTANGDPDPESLTVRGWQRAGALVGLFIPRPGASGTTTLPTPTHLFASRVGESVSDSRRPRETLEPLSQRLGIAIDDRFLKAQVEELVAAVRGCDGTVLVAWEHKMLPPIATLLAGVAVDVPDVWPDDRFDVLWIFEPDEAGERYRFTQVPETLLAGDLDEPI